MKTPRSFSTECFVQKLRQFIPPSYLVESYLTEVAGRWSERHRYWHGPSHLISLIETIAETAEGQDRDILLIAALYHDAIYDPRSNANEEASATLLQKHAVDATSYVIRQAVEIIIKSKWSEEPDSALTRRFFELDTYQLSADCSLSERVEYELAIFREYQFAPWNEYREKRGAFLREWANRHPQHRSGSLACLELLAVMKPRIAIYPGSFNPFHLGYLSILRQAEASFDKVVIAAGVNRQKSGAVEELVRRRKELQLRLRFHEVSSFSGLVTDHIENLPYPVTIVRGVRDGTDLEAELRYARFLNDLRAETNLIWISCRPELQHVSSSAIRELEEIKPGAGERYIPNASMIYGLIDDEPSDHLATYDAVASG